MGGIVQGARTLGAAAPNPQESLEQKVERLTKLVHILWKEAERLESVVQVMSDGIRIKTGAAELSLTKTGGVIIHGQRIHLKSSTKEESWF